MLTKIAHFDNQKFDGVSCQIPAVTRESTNRFLPGRARNTLGCRCEYDEWRKENPDWDKDWSKGSGGVVSGTGDVYSRTDGGWNEVLSKVAQVPGSKVKPQKRFP